MKKNRSLPALGLGVLAVLLGGWVVLADGHHDDDDDGDARSGNSFALFHGVDPASELGGAVCSATKGKAFTYHVAVTNHVAGGNGFVQITYKSGDFLSFPIAPGATLTFTQAAGSSGGADRAVRVSNGASAARLIGVMSAEGATCLSCDADEQGGVGNARCSSIVPIPTLQ
jgi:hypothetical protein